MRVVIAEDNVLLSSGLELLLGSQGFEVAAITDDAPGFLAAVETHRPDVTIVDVRLPPTFRDEGIRAALRARRDHPGLPVLVLSQYVELEYAGRLLSDTRGGIGYLLKDRVSRIAEFTDALRRVAAGGTAMDPEVITQLLAVRGDPVDALTPREREVLALMAEGHDNATIAQRLSSPTTPSTNTSAVSSSNSACRSATAATAGSAPSWPTSAATAAPNPAPVEQSTD